jgi:hypothetical protein
LIERERYHILVNQSLIFVSQMLDKLGNRRLPVASAPYNRRRFVQTQGLVSVQIVHEYFISQRVNY